MAADWDDLRRRFQDSDLKEMELAKLGQNAGIPWPFKGAGETPAKYTDMSYDALQSVPGLIGKPSRIKALMAIFRETLAFDDPFGAMADKVENESLVDETIARNLDKFSINGAFPIRLVDFSGTTRDQLAREGVTTIMELVEVGQKGFAMEGLDAEAKQLLIALGNKDEAQLARLLPYREGGQGLHLPEAISRLAEKLDEGIQLSLMADCGVELKPNEQAKVEALDETELERALAACLESIKEYCAWFEDEAKEIAERYSAGGEPERSFLFLNNPTKERLAVELAAHYFAPDRRRSSGFLSRLFGRS